MYNKDGHGNQLYPGYKGMIDFLKIIRKEHLQDEMCSKIEKLNTPWFQGDDGPWWWDYTEYMEKSVVPHKVAVYEEGMRLYSYVKDHMYKDYWEDHLINHDLSKFSHAEKAYAWKFFGDKKVYNSGRVTGYDDKSFQYAWFHHKSCNPHHPEWWHCVERDGSVSNCFPMEKIYAIEMLADWVGAGRTYNGNLHDWINKNLPEFKIHNESIGHIIKPLKEVYGLSLDKYSKTAEIISKPLEEEDTYIFRFKNSYSGGILEFPGIEGMYVRKKFEDLVSNKKEILEHEGYVINIACGSWEWNDSNAVSAPGCGEPWFMMGSKVIRM